MNPRGTDRGTIRFVDPRLVRLLDLLDRTDEETVGTSIRLPVTLRDAAVVAVELGLAGSTTELTVRGLRDLLAAAARRAVLDAHYEAHSDARPDLAEIALAAAQLDSHPLATRPELIRRAAAEIVSIIDDPTPDEVLSYAAGLAGGLRRRRASCGCHREQGGYDRRAHQRRHRRPPDSRVPRRQRDRRGTVNCTRTGLPWP